MFLRSRYFKEENGFFTATIVTSVQLAPQTA
jgi:hypothetical protein